MVTKTEREAAQAKVNKWLANAQRSVSSQLGVRLLAGERLRKEEGTELGAGPQALNQVVAVLRAAGYPVVREHVGGHQHEVFVEGATGRSAASTNGKAPARKHPSLGDVLTVRGLSLDEGGELVMHLSNGSTTWAALVIGQAQ